MPPILSSVDFTERSDFPRYALCIAVLFVALIYPLTGITAPGDTTLVMKSRPSGTAAVESVKPLISSDGRFVVFRSTAPNLISGDDNRSDDIFVFDRTTSTTVRIEDPRACTDPVEPDFRITDASINGTGRYVLWSVTDHCDFDDATTASLILLDRQTDTRRVLHTVIDFEFVSARFSGDSKFVVFEMSDFTIRLHELSSNQTIVVDDSGYSPSINSDGSLIVFASSSSGLVAGDTNGVADIFLYRRATGQIERISMSSVGAQANGPSEEPVISVNSSVVVYSSSASNLVAGDTNGVTDVFSFRLASGSTSRISKASSNIQLDGASRRPSISSDGRYVGFASLATNAVAGDTNDAEDVFLRDRQGAITTRLSVSEAGDQANGASTEVAMSGNGRYFAYLTKASNLASNDKNRADDVFLLDRQTHAVSLVTKSTTPVAGIGAGEAAISGDSTLIAFSSTASNLVAKDTNDTRDIFLRNLKTGTITRVSRPNGNAESDGESFSPSMSRDGRFVAFVSSATNLVPMDTNRAFDIFVRDRQNATTERATVSSTGVQANELTFDARISGNGRFVLFETNASNLVPGDEAFSFDLFTRDLVAGTTERVNVTSGGQRIALVPGDVSISANGRWIAFPTRENLVAGDTEFDADVYLKDRQSGTLERISVPATTGGAGPCCEVEVGPITPDGRYVAFASSSPNIVPGDTNGRPDIFIRDRQLGTTARASVFPGTISANVRSVVGASISDDGRYVSFDVGSGPSPSDGPRLSEVFFRDMQKNLSVRASRSSAGIAANANSFDSSISADGRFVFFTSVATNLVSEPIEDGTIFLHER